MKKRGINENTIRKADLVYQLVKQHYEPGRQDRCLLWVFRHIVVKTYPMSVGTFWRLLQIAEKKNGKISQKH